MTNVDVKKGYKEVLLKIEQAADRRIPELKYSQPHLVAASKTRTVEEIIEAYEEGQRDFGENYVQELKDKANSEKILEKSKDIRWHFIGHLQSNKVNTVLCLPNIYMIESVHSQKLADLLNKNWPKFAKQDSKLKVLVQVNTSGEDEKSGIKPSEVVNVTKYVLNDCKNLEFSGLMAIGKYGYDPADGPNPDFISLKQCREEVSKQLNIDWRTIPLSMGMSNDYEQAIEMGSYYVRVGTAIFGPRTRKINTFS